jgi:hypothetical protein
VKIKNLGRKANQLQILRDAKLSLDRGCLYATFS